MSKETEKDKNLDQNSSGVFPIQEKIDLTGAVEEGKPFKLIKYPFDRYVVGIALTEDNQFLGITEIQFNKDFRNFKEKQYSQISLNVEDYYFEE